MKSLACPHCEKPHTARGKGKHYTEIKTVGSKVYFVAVCCTCKHTQFLPVKVKAKNCGRVIHCGTNNRHKVMLTDTSIIVSCGVCNEHLSFTRRTT